MRLMSQIQKWSSRRLYAARGWSGDFDMSGYRIAGLNTSLPPRRTDAVCWSRAVELTRGVGQRASEQVMDLKRLCD